MTTQPPLELNPDTSKTMKLLPALNKHISFAHALALSLRLMETFDRLAAADDISETIALEGETVQIIGRRLATGAEITLRREYGPAPQREEPSRGGFERSLLAVSRRKTLLLRHQKDGEVRWSEKATLTEDGRVLCAGLPVEVEREIVLHVSLAFTSGRIDNDGEVYEWSVQP
jgi:hypothetical protein